MGKGGIKELWGRGGKIGKEVDVVVVWIVILVIDRGCDGRFNYLLGNLLFREGIWLV